MKLNDAEIQVLASIRLAEIENSARDRSSLEASGHRYRHFRADWSKAFDSLADKALIDGDDNGYQLTPAGRGPAERYHSERPDLYWYHYQVFYPTAFASPVHSEFCRRVFGKDLCQEGQTDMASLEHMLEQLDLRKGEKVLDLGCGAGVVSEYISDLTGVHMTGIDYAASAIAEATGRTENRRQRLQFQQGNFAELDLEPESLDAVIAIDTLYWDDLLEQTITTITNALRPGGRIGIFLNHHIDQEDSAELLEPQHSRLFQVMSELPLSVETFDYNLELETFWRALLESTIDLKAQFEAEGNGFIAENYLREALEDHLPEIDAARIARHLYIARKTTG